MIRSSIIYSRIYSERDQVSNQSILPKMLAIPCWIGYTYAIVIEKEQKMQAQFAALPIRLQSAMLKELRAINAQCRADLKAGKELLKADRAAAKAAKAEAAATRRSAAIEKAQARLEKLLAKQAAPVGAKALKANRKPSKVTTYGAEDNAIAASIMAKKASV